MLLCIFDSLRPDYSQHGDVNMAQKTFNALSLVSKDVLSLVRRVRYKQLVVRHSDGAKPLIAKADSALSSIIRHQLRTITLGNDDDELEIETDFAELLAVVAGGSQLHTMSVRWTQLDGLIFWAIRNRQSRPPGRLWKPALIPRLSNCRFQGARAM